MEHTIASFGFIECIRITIVGIGFNIHEMPVLISLKTVFDVTDQFSVLRGRNVDLSAGVSKPELIVKSGMDGSSA